MDPFRQYETIGSEMLPDIPYEIPKRIDPLSAMPGTHTRIQPQSKPLTGEPVMPPMETDPLAPPAPTLAQTPRPAPPSKFSLSDIVNNPSKYRKFIVAFAAFGITLLGHFVGVDSWLFQAVVAFLGATGVLYIPNEKPII